jgi:hypothetical protein
MDEFLASSDRWLPIVLGAVLLVVGRRLFWLLVATLGFLFAFTLVERMAPESPEPLHWVLAIAAGVVGAVLAIFAQQLAVGAAGMLFGAYVALWIVEGYAIDLGGWEWIALLAGGVLGAVLALLVLDTALVVVSSILGASLLVGAARLDGLPAVVLFAFLVVIGVAVQTRSGGALPARRRRRAAPVTDE